jgi:hypothetical protein
MTMGRFRYLVLALALPLLLLAASCGGSKPADDPADWKLDTSGWPDCGWPEGTVVYGNLDGELWVRSLDGTVNKRIGSNDQLRTWMGLEEGYFVPNRLDLSPDRRWIAIEMAWLIEGNSRLFALSCDASVVRPIGTNLGRYNGNPKFSPDGKRLAFMRTQNPDGLSGGVFVLELASGTWLNFERGTWPLNWMPDGKELLIGDMVYNEELNNTQSILYGGNTETGELVVRASPPAPGTRTCTWAASIDAILCQSDYVYRLGKPDEPQQYLEPPTAPHCFIGEHPAIGPDGALYSSGWSGGDFVRLEFGNCPGEDIWNENGSPEVWVFSF